MQKTLTKKQGEKFEVIFLSSKGRDEERQRERGLYPK